LLPGQTPAHVGGGGKPGRISADLGEDDFGGSAADAGLMVAVRTTAGSTSINM
jgi:hypothetical protein